MSSVLSLPRHVGGAAVSVSRQTVRVARWAARNVLPLVAVAVAAVTALALLAGPFHSWEQMRQTRTQLGTQLEVLERGNRQAEARLTSASDEVSARLAGSRRFGLADAGGVLVRLEQPARPQAPTLVSSGSR